MMIMIMTYVQQWIATGWYGDDDDAIFRTHRIDPPRSLSTAYIAVDWRPVVDRRVRRVDAVVTARTHQLKFSWNNN